MLPMIGSPQGAEWLIILLIVGAVVVVPVALLVWLVVKLANR
jgi:hypothetical protein